jgi:hypothetical protein
MYWIGCILWVSIALIYSEEIENLSFFHKCMLGIGACIVYLLFEILKKKLKGMENG